MCVCRGGAELRWGEEVGREGDNTNVKSLVRERGEERWEREVEEVEEGWRGVRHSRQIAHW